MNIGKKNILSLQKNAFGPYVINKIVSKEKSIDVNYKINSKVSSEHEIKSFAKGIDFQYNTNFILIGIGNGEILKYLYKNMSKYSNIIVIERNKSVFIETLGKIDLSIILKDTRVIPILENQPEEIFKYMEVISAIDSIYYNIKHIKFITMPYLKSEDEIYVNTIKYKIIEIFKTKLETNGNDVGDMLEGLDHIIKNIKNIDRSLSINKFKDKYRNKPAIIVSGGPSLNKNIDKLKYAYKKAMILTVDTTAKKVIEMGINPDCITTIERPDNMYNIFYENMEVPKETVFVGPPVVTPKILDKFENIILPGRSGEIFVKDILNEIGYEDIELGMGCATLAFAFARYVNADPIIFIGQDLAFASSGETHFSEASEATKKGAQNSTVVYVENEDGMKMQTTKLYKEFLIWFEKEILKDDKRTYINATEGGAKISGTVRMKFSDAIEKYCNEEITTLYDNYLEIEKEKNKKDTVNIIYEFIRLKKEQLLDIKKNIPNYKINIDKLKEDDTKTLDSIIYNNRMMFYNLVPDRMISFLYQTIRNRFNIEIASYSNNMNDDDWKKIFFINDQFYNQCMDVTDKLIDEFDKHEKYIKGMLNNSKEKM